MNEQQEYEEPRPVGLDLSRLIFGAAAVIPLSVFILAVMALLAGIYLTIAAN
jgi:hypothetical protein